MNMQRNGFYAAVKTNEGVQAIYINEETLRARLEDGAAKQHREKERKAQRKKTADMNREKQDTIHVLKQELKLLGMGAVLYWGYSVGLVELSFAAPVLIAFQTLICFRAGRWLGRRERESK